MTEAARTHDATVQRKARTNCPRCPSTPSPQGPGHCSCTHDSPAGLHTWDTGFGSALTVFTGQPFRGTHTLHIAHRYAHHGATKPRTALVSAQHEAADPGPQPAVKRTAGGATQHVTRHPRLTRAWVITPPPLVTCTEAATRHLLITPKTRHSTNPNGTRTKLIMVPGQPD